MTFYDQLLAFKQRHAGTVMYSVKDILQPVFGTEWQNVQLLVQGCIF